ncbi:hypothetical protein QYE76_031708 [Lolium multiflorum]|uniref:CCHC-type domain-containing protein n=1 Tax=Lolium multiflorum TaxID=4521 RepID=A0AAD8QTD4_LOLMU|nr:hypothetical protein QYE76_031708 [Lolium multiflorum]
MGVHRVAEGTPGGPLTPEEDKAFGDATVIFVGAILSVLGDKLVDAISHIRNGKELGDALDAKFGAADAGGVYAMEQFNDYRMIENRSVVEQAHEIQIMAKELELLKCVLPDKFVAGCIVAKLPPSWRNFATSLKHQRHEFSVENIMGSLDVEEKARAKDKHTGGIEGRSAANMVQKNAHKSKGKNKGVSQTTNFKKKGKIEKKDLCWVCGETGHWANRCPQREGKKGQAGQTSNSVNMVIGNTGEGTTWSNPVKLSIVPIGGIHIFIGETVDSDGNALVSNADASAAELDAVAKIRSESQELPKEGDALHQDEADPLQVEAPETTLLRICGVGDDVRARGSRNPEESILDPEALEAKQEMLATAQKFARTAAAMLEERTLAANFVDYSLKKDREVDEMMATTKGLRKEWEKRLASAQAEADRITREAIPPRRITFATPTEQQPLATPKDNMKKVAELLKKKDEEIDINYVRKLVASNAKNRGRHFAQVGIQSGAPHIHAQKDATAETSIVSHHRHPELRPPLPPRRSPTETPAPWAGGINIRDNMPPPRDRSRERTPEPREAGTKTASPSLVETKNASPSLAEAKDASRNQGGAGTKSAHRSHAGAERRRRPPPRGRSHRAGAARTTPRIRRRKIILQAPSQISLATTQEAEEARQRPEVPFPIKITWRRSPRCPGAPQRVQIRLHWSKVLWPDDPRGTKAKKLEP